MNIGFIYTNLLFILLSVSCVVNSRFEGANKSTQTDIEAVLRANENTTISLKRAMNTRVPGTLLRLGNVELEVGFTGETCKSWLSRNGVGGIYNSYVYHEKGDTYNSDFCLYESVGIDSDGSCHLVNYLNPNKDVSKMQWRPTQKCLSAEKGKFELYLALEYLGPVYPTTSVLSPEEWVQSCEKIYQLSTCATGVNHRQAVSNTLFELHTYFDSFDIDPTSGITNTEFLVYAMEIYGGISSVQENLKHMRGRFCQKLKYEKIPTWFEEATSQEISELEIEKYWCYVGELGYDENGLKNEVLLNPDQSSVPLCLMTTYNCCHPSIPENECNLN